MTFFNKIKLPVVTGFFLVLSFFSCTEDETKLGTPVIGSQPFTANKAEFDVFAYNKKITAIRTSRLPVNQLGTYIDPVYGKTKGHITTQLALSVANPTFGLLSAADELSDGENENEQIDSVFLYIPYLTKSIDTDGDGVLDINDKDIDADNDNDGDGIFNYQESLNGTDPLDATSYDNTVTGFIANNFAKTYDVDSVYGQTNAPIKIKVTQSTYFLRNLDPDTNFEDSQAYASNEDFTQFSKEVLFDGEFVFSDKEILLEGGTEDDEDTDTVDESKTFTKLAPGIRIPLKADFFQRNLIGKEGSIDLLTQSNFVEYLRGIHITMPDDATTMFLLNLSAANITVSYTYTDFDTDDDTEETEETEETSSYTLALGSTYINTIVNDQLSGTVSNAMDTDTDVSRIYLKGGPGSFSEIKLFDNSNSDEVINTIKAKKWIITEANIILNVDSDVVNPDGNTPEPIRLYLYNRETGNIIFNTGYDNSGTNLWDIHPYYDGILQESNGKGVQYKFKITEHINNIIIRDSTNATLGLSILPNFNYRYPLEGELEDSSLENQDVIYGNNLTPLGTVLYGSNVEAENTDKKLKLELYYTEVE